MKLNFDSIVGVEIGEFRDILISVLDGNSCFMEEISLKARRELGFALVKEEDCHGRSYLPLIKKYVKLIKCQESSEYERLVLHGAKFMGLEREIGSYAMRNKEELIFRDPSKLAIISVYVKEVLIPEILDSLENIPVEERKSLAILIKSMSESELADLIFESFFNK